VFHIKAKKRVDNKDTIYLTIRYTYPTFSAISASELIVSSFSSM